MGGDGLDEKLLATLESVKKHGGVQWWLYLGRCRVCRQDWLVAQEERIYDEHFLQRLNPHEAERVIVQGIWPDTFISYERVLRIGQSLTNPCRFLDPRAVSLISTVEDLRKERPEISAAEIADLLGIGVNHSTKLMAASGAEADQNVWRRAFTVVKAAHGYAAKLFGRK